MDDKLVRQVRGTATALEDARRQVDAELEHAKAELDAVTARIAELEELRDQLSSAIDAAERTAKAGSSRAAKKATAKKATAKKATAKKATARKRTRKATAKRTAAKRATAKRATTKRTATPPATSPSTPPAAPTGFPSRPVDPTL